MGCEAKDISKMLAKNSFVIEDVKIVTGDQCIDNGYVYVKRGRIAAVGPGRFRNGKPTGLAIFSRPGSTIITGFVNTVFPTPSVGSTT